MALDTAEVGRFAMEAIDAIVEHFQETHPDAKLEVCDLMLVAAIDIDDEKTDVSFFSTERRGFRNEGLIRGALHACVGTPGDDA